MTTKPFRTLRPELKLAVLSWLCDSALASQTIRNHLETQQSASSSVSSQRTSRSFNLEKYVAAQSSSNMYVDSLLLPIGMTRGSAASLLGCDRNHSRYWFFKGDITGRIWVETKNGGFTTSYRETEEIDRLLKTLNKQGIRENALAKAIQSRRDDILAAQMQHCALYTPSRIMGSELLTKESFEAQIRELLCKNELNLNRVSRNECVLAMKELVRRRWVPVALVPFLKCSIHSSVSSLMSILYVVTFSFMFSTLHHLEQIKTQTHTFNYCWHESSFYGIKILTCVFEE